MFKHVVEINGKFYLRKWNIMGVKTWDEDGNWWWFDHPHHWTAFDSFEDAKNAARYPRFVGWV